MRITKTLPTEPTITESTITEPTIIEPTITESTITEPTIASMLIAWYRQHGRDLPWRRTRDPYKILVSEVMLQQTQVERVLPKYEAWIGKFPTWSALANASREEVLKAWSGLGYNRRAVRLHILARLVVGEFAGKLPASEDALVKLPGIGPYTAGAVMVFAHNKPGTCLDVNVERVVRRCFGIRSKEKEKVGEEKNIEGKNTERKKTEKKNRKGKNLERKNVEGKSAGEKKSVERTLLRLFPKRRARLVGNALMDLGALVCTATNPSCHECPLKEVCHTKGVLPGERRKRQPRFLHSNRWWRGQIVKGVTAGIPRRELYDWIVQHQGHRDTVAFRRAFAELEAEGLLPSFFREV